MRILLTKISDRHHAVEIVRADGSRDAIELVTREALSHDFLHFAVEASMPTQRGFWGSLASGRTFTDMNDRSGASFRENAVTLGIVEGTVGVMTGYLKQDLREEEAVARFRRSQEELGREAPEWFTERFVTEVRERIRQLHGHWKATPYGQSMQITWAEG